MMKHKAEIHLSRTFNRSSMIYSMFQCPFLSQLPKSARFILCRHSSILKTNDEKFECPFLQNSSRALRRVLIDNDAIEFNRNSMFQYESLLIEKIEKKKKDHSYRIFKQIERKSGNFPRAEIQTATDKRPVTVWCSNDYLGLSQHPKLKQAVIDAVTAFGSGSGGTRNISGTSPLHDQLEKKLARLHHKDAALLFTSCYVANDTTLYTLAKAFPDCYILSDSGNHASMIQGIRNSQAKKSIFRHNDVQDLENCLKRIPREQAKIVAFETVHSMDGSICSLETMLDLSHSYGALTFVDEVHAVGLYGDHGAGIAERDGVLSKVDIVSGTLGKAFGSIGGYIASSTTIVDFVRSYGSGLIFTTSMPPTVLASALAAIQISMSDEGRILRNRQQENVRRLRLKLIQAGLPVIHSPSHIIPIHVGNAAIANLVCEQLLMRHSIYIQAINYPTVPRGSERLRIAPTPHHTDQMIDELVQALDEVWTNVLDNWNQ